MESRDTTCHIDCITVCTVILFSALKLLVKEFVVYEKICSERSTAEGGRGIASILYFMCTTTEGGTMITSGHSKPGVSPPDNHMVLNPSYSVGFLGLIIVR